MCFFPYNLGGKYSGKVVSPDAQRVVAYRQLAELAEKPGESGPALLNFDPKMGKAGQDAGVRTGNSIHRRTAMTTTGPNVRCGIHAV
jgi:hypothetical protein